MKFGSLEEHVFEKVSHSRFAVTFMTRADEDGAVDGDFRLTAILEEQNAQSVFECVFVDSFDGCDFLGHRVLSNSVRCKRGQETKGNQEGLADRSS